MSENSFKPQVDQAKADIRSIVEEMKNLDGKVVESSKIVRENLKGAFKISTPDGLNQLMKDLNTTMTQLNSTLEKQTDNTKKLSGARKNLTTNIQKQIELNAKNQNSLSGSTREEVRRNEALKKAFDRQEHLSRSYVKLIAKQKQAKKVLQDSVVSFGKNAKATKLAQKEFDKYTAKVNQANKATSNFSNNSLGGMVRGFKNLIGAFGVIGGVTLFASIAKDIFQITKQLESLNFSLKAVTTSEEEFTRVQLFLKDITQRYGAEIVTVTERYTKFLAAAKQSNLSLAKTEKIFESVTKASGVLGLKTDELTGVYLALEQMLSKGKVTTEELRRQLGERLPGAFGIMADALGVSVAQLDKMLRKGEVLSSEALPKFADALEKAYGIESVETIDTLIAAQTRLSNSWINLVDSFNNSEGKLTKFFKFFIDGFTDILELLTEFNTSDEDIFAKALKGLENEAVKEGLIEIEVAAIKAGVSMKDFAENAMARLRYNSKATANDVSLLKGELNALVEDGPNGGGRGALQAYNKELKELKKLLKEAENSAAIARGKLGAALQITSDGETDSPSGNGNTGNLKKGDGIAKGSLAFFEKQIKLAEQAQQKIATGTEEYNKQADAIKKAKEELEKLKAVLGIREDSTEVSLPGRNTVNESGEVERTSGLGFAESEEEGFGLPEPSELEAIANGLTSKVKKAIDETTISGEEMKAVFEAATETFADIFDIDISKFDFLFDELENSVSDWAELSRELIGSVLDASLNKYEIELQEAQRSRDLILENELSTERQKRLARQKFEREERKIKTERAKAERRNNLIKIAVDTSVAVVKALASAPPPANFVLAGVVGALGLAQAAIVASQPIPRFAEGHLAGTHSGKALINDAKRSDYQEVVERGGGQVEIYKNRNQIIDMKRGDKVHKSEDSFLTHHNIEKDIVAMSMQSHREQLILADRGDKLSGKIDEMKAQFAETAERMESLGKRPIHNHNHITIEPEYDNYNS